MAHAPGRLGLSPGTEGSLISIITNSFAVSKLPTRTFVHYDEFPDFENGLPPRRDRALEIIDKLQMQEATIFHPRAAYDGQRNMFRSTPLNLLNNGGTFHVSFGNPSAATRARGVTVKVTRVATIDPRSLLAVVNGQTGYGSESLTALTLLNVLIRMKPIMTYPSHGNSFFTQDIREVLGGGLEVWRGLFQSVRPTLHRLLVNIDITTAVMYNSGSLVDLILAFLNINDTRHLSPRHLKPPSQARLNSFLKGLSVWSTVPARPGPQRRCRRIARVVMTGADDYLFTNDRNGRRLSISAHFQEAYQYRMQLGGAICVDVGKDIVYPIEVLQVKEGQMYRKALPSALTPRALKFSTQKPNDRMLAIQRGTQLFGYADSDFLRQSGMEIDERLVKIDARVLPPPPIQWGGDQPPDAPRDGAWNVLRRKFHTPATVRAWAVVVYDSRLNNNQVLGFLRMFVEACTALGMKFPNRPPEVISGRPGVDDRGHHDDMERAGVAALRSFDDQFEGGGARKPTFIFVILPDSAIDIRTSVKNWGDCIRGCPTQCMKSGKLPRANNQYCNNLALKVNAKLGGVNSIPSSSVATMKWLAKEPTMVIGADVSHASPGTDRPSVTGLVSSVDEHFSRYVASTTIQEPRAEIIADLGVMIENAVHKFNMFWEFMRRAPNVFPQRIIFYRDGVSEGQFKEVGEKEVQQIKACLAALWKNRNIGGSPPKLTFIIVGKRHHVRFFPRDGRDADKSGNCPPGMVVDREIVSPVGYDFYLQSHGGMLGTSRPSHYSVIEDGNGLGADMLQAVSYTLCHVYARATRSVSIPAPVYYADIVSARGRFHSKLIRDGTDSALSIVSGEKPTLKDHQEAFRDLAENAQISMYFM